MVHEFAIVNDRPQGDTVYRVAVNEDFQHDEVVNVEPLVRQKFRNVVRQAYDYSCGSAALQAATNRQPVLGRHVVIIP